SLSNRPSFPGKGTYQLAKFNAFPGNVGFSSGLLEVQDQAVRVGEGEGPQAAAAGRGHAQPPAVDRLEVPRLLGFFQFRVAGLVVGRPGRAHCGGAVNDDPNAAISLQVEGLAAGVASEVGVVLTGYGEGRHRARELDDE